MSFRTRLALPASENPDQLLSLWRKERAFRVGSNLCAFGFVLSSIALIGDIFFSPPLIIATDSLIVIGCAASLLMRNSKFRDYFWLPAFVCYWISIYPSAWVSGGINSPFLGLNLVALYVFGTVLDSRNRSYWYLILALAHLPLFYALERFPASIDTPTPGLITFIQTLIIAAIATCVVSILKTERELSKEFADHLRTLAEEKNAKELAENAGQAKMQFLANMSHEIRTPMNSILGFSELIASDDCSDQERREYLGRIRKNGSQLLHLIDDILDLSKFEAGRIPLYRTSFSLASLMDDAICSFQPALQAKGLRLEISSDGDTTTRIFSDKLRISQIFTNLLSNAIKFSKSGSIRISLRSLPIPDSSTLQITFDIEDNGIGISADGQKNLFHPFRQSDNSISRNFGGTGLGLALSKRIAEALGGTLELKSSAPGKGSHFQLKFPAETAEAEAAFSSGEASVATAEADGIFDGKRILLVEDSPDNALLVCHYVKSSGAKVDIATDGYQAVAMARDAAYDCILMDVQMPGMDGLEATRQIRSAGYDKSIIALTAHALPAESNRSRDAGCDLHLTKPINRKELILALSTRLH